MLFPKEPQQPKPKDGKSIYCSVSYGLLSRYAEFTFTYPDTDGKAKTCKAYCSNTGLTYENARLGLYRNYKFTVIEC